MSASSGKVLIVNDEPEVRVSLRTLLASSGFMISEAERAEEALALACVSSFDAVLLDDSLPSLGGVELCQTIRKVLPSAPILMLTTQDDEAREAEVVKGCADDYVATPYQPRELVERLRTLLRRGRPKENSRTELVIGDVLLDSARHLVKKAGRAVHLTPKQFDLLQFLMRNAGRPVSHARLLRSVWGPEYGSELEYLRTYVRQVRVKIEDDPANPRYLLTEPYIGYRFVEPCSSLE